MDSLLKVGPPLGKSWLQLCTERIYHVMLIFFSSNFKPSLCQVHVAVAKHCCLIKIHITQLYHTRSGPNYYIVINYNSFLNGNHGTKHWKIYFPWAISLYFSRAIKSIRWFAALLSPYQNLSLCMSGDHRWGWISLSLLYISIQHASHCIWSRGETLFNLMHCNRRSDWDQCDGGTPISVFVTWTISGNLMRFNLVASAHGRNFPPLHVRRRHNLHVTVTYVLILEGTTVYIQYLERLALVKGNRALV